MLWVLRSTQVLQIVRKFADEQFENGSKRLSVPSVYQFIKNSNSSLKRRKKPELENSIERVLQVLKEEQDDSDSLDGNFDGIEDEPPQLKVSESRVLQVLGSKGNQSLLLLGT